MISGLTRLGPGDLWLRCETIFGGPETGSHLRLRLLGLRPIRFTRRLNRCPMTSESELELDAESNSAGVLDKHLSKATTFGCDEWPLFVDQQTDGQILASVGCVRDIQADD